MATVFSVQVPAIPQPAGQLNDVQQQGLQMCQMVKARLDQFNADGVMLGGAWDVGVDKLTNPGPVVAHPGSTSTGTVPYSGTNQPPAPGNTP